MCVYGAFFVGRGLLFLATLKQQQQQLPPPGCCIEEVADTTEGLREGAVGEEWAEVEEEERDGRKTDSREANPTLELCFWEESLAAPTPLSLSLSCSNVLPLFFTLQS